MAAPSVSSTGGTPAKRQPDTSNGVNITAGSHGKLSVTGGREEARARRTSTSGHAPSCWNHVPYGHSSRAIQNGNQYLRVLNADSGCCESPRLTGVTRRPLSVLHDPLLADDAQITGAISGAAAEGK
jgi:hypothetical protein